MKTEQDIRKQAAERFAAAKAAKTAAAAEEREAEHQVTVAEQKPPPEPKRPEDYGVGTLVRSLTVATAVPLLGSETRSISAARVDMQASGLRMRTVTLGIEICYRGRDLKSRTLLVPWGNVGSFEPEL